MHSWSVLNIYHKVFISTTDSEEKKIQRNLDAIFSYTDSSNFSNNLYEDVKMITSVRSKTRTGRVRAGCFQTSNYTPRSAFKIAHWTISFSRYHFGHGALRRRVGRRVRSSRREQWYLLRRQRDVTDRELALWSRSVGVAVGERGGRWKRGRERGANSLSLSLLAYIRFVYRCRSSKHMVRRRGGGPPLQVSASRFISHRTRSLIANLPLLSIHDITNRESSSSFSPRVTWDDPL